MLRTAVIGVGYLGRHHARVLSELEDVELVAVVDIEADRAKEVAGEYGCKAYSDYRDVLPYVDAVTIATPTTTHYEIARDCLRQGLHIMIEKPITSTSQEAERLIGEIEATGRCVQIGHLERYNPALLAAEPLFERIRFIESLRLSPFLGRGTDVDVTVDLMIHDIDIILSILPNRIVDIKAVGASVVTERIDVAKAWIEFEDVSALVTSSRLSGKKKRVLKVFQENGFLEIDLYSNRVKHYYKKNGRVCERLIEPPHREPLKEEIKDFLQAIKKGHRPKVDALQASRALKVAEEISSRIKRRINGKGSYG